MFNETNVITHLEKPIKLEDIINKCPEFSIRSDEVRDEAAIEEDTDITKVYDFDELQKYHLPEVLDPGSDDEDTLNPDRISNSFPYYRKRMTNVTPDGTVMKLIEKEGSGNAIGDTEKLILAYVHYASYIEFAENPFDVTWLRQKNPVALRLGDDYIIPGLEFAIRSMKKKERAKFLIDYSVAYGIRGCPPRIPPKSTILFDVELDSFVVDIEEKNLDELTFRERMDEVNKILMMGNEMKRVGKNVTGAITQYRKAIQLVLHRYADEEEENEAQAKLLKLYSNLAICYMAKKDYKKVCTAYNNAVLDCPRLIGSSSKLLLNSAKALRFLNDFDEAFRRLEKALKISPGNEYIIKELDSLVKYKEKCTQNEKERCRKMFGFSTPFTIMSEEAKFNEFIKSVDEEFRDECNAVLDAFMESDDNTEEISPGSTIAEVEYFRKQCEKRNIEVKVISRDELSKLPKLHLRKRAF